MMFFLCIIGTYWRHKVVMGIEVDEGPTNNEFIEESRQDDDGKVK